MSSVIMKVIRVGVSVVGGSGLDIIHRTKGCLDLDPSFWGLGLTLPSSIFLSQKLNTLFLLYPIVHHTQLFPWQRTFHKHSKNLALTRVPTTGKTVTLALDKGSFPTPSPPSPKEIPPSFKNKQAVHLQSR